jgi:hypothetical protein
MVTALGYQEGIVRGRAAIQSSETFAARMKSQNVPTGQLIEFARQLNNARQHMALWYCVGAIPQNHCDDKTGRNGVVKIIGLAN